MSKRHPLTEEEKRKRKYISHKKYSRTVRGKAAIARADKKHRNKEERLEYQKEYQTKYNKSKEGNINKAKAGAKERGFGFNVLFPNPFSSETKIHWHHVNDTDVVAVPAEVHKDNSNPDPKEHRRLMEPIVEEIYGNIFNEDREDAPF